MCGARRERHPKCRYECCVRASGHATRGANVQQQQQHGVAGGRRPRKRPRGPRYPTCTCSSLVQSGNAPRRGRGAAVRPRLQARARGAPGARTACAQLLMQQCAGGGDGGGAMTSESELRDLELHLSVFIAEIARIGVSSAETAAAAGEEPTPTTLSVDDMRAVILDDAAKAAFIKDCGRTNKEKLKGGFKQSLCVSRVHCRAAAVLTQRTLLCWVRSRRATAAAARASCSSRTAGATRSCLPRQT